jgi:sugar/nucleoside kinase (ribokinase family)
MRRLVSVGNVLIDLLLDLPALPSAGDDVTATGSDSSAGGAFNVLVAARRQGLPAVYAGAHGTGPFGDAARTALAAWVPSVPEGVIVIIDPGPLGEAIPDAVRARADWWSSAAGEAVGGRSRILRRGAAGCDLDGERIAGFEVTAIDTNGAGDAHVGVFAASLALGFDPRTAAVRANAAAALAVTRRGPATAPTRDELERFLVA